MIKRTPLPSHLRFRHRMSVNHIRSNAMTYNNYCHYNMVMKRGIRLGAWMKPSTVLVCGDTDFLFTRHLVQAEDNLLVTCTTILSEEQFRVKYPYWVSNDEDDNEASEDNHGRTVQEDIQLLAAKKNNRVQFVYNVNPLSLPASLSASIPLSSSVSSPDSPSSLQSAISNTFNIIVWNFPRIDFKASRCSSTEGKFLREFFNSAKPLLSSQGKIMISTTPWQSGVSCRDMSVYNASWKLAEQVSESDMMIVKQEPYNRKSYEKYLPVDHRGRPQRDASLHNAKVYTCVPYDIEKTLRKIVTQQPEAIRPSIDSAMYAQEIVMILDSEELELAYETRPNIRSYGVPMSFYRIEKTLRFAINGIASRNDFARLLWMIDIVDVYKFPGNQSDEPKFADGGHDKHKDSGRYKVSVQIAFASSIIPVTQEDVRKAMTRILEELPQQISFRFQAAKDLNQTRHKSYPFFFAQRLKAEAELKEVERCLYVCRDLIKGSFDNNEHKRPLPSSSLPPNMPPVLIEFQLLARGVDELTNSSKQSLAQSYSKQNSRLDSQKARHDDKDGIRLHGRKEEIDGTSKRNSGAGAGGVVGRKVLDAANVSDAGSSVNSSQLDVAVDILNVSGAARIPRAGEFSIAQDSICRSRTVSSSDSNADNDASVSFESIQRIYRMNEVENQTWVAAAAMRRKSVSYWK